MILVHIINGQPHDYSSIPFIVCYIVNSGLMVALTSIFSFNGILMGIYCSWGL